MELCTNATQSFKASRSYTESNQLLLRHSQMPHTTYLLHQTTRKMTPMVEGPSGKRIKSANENTTSERTQKKEERKVNYAVNKIKILPCHNPLTRSRHCFEYDPAFPAASHCHPQLNVSVKEKKNIDQVFTVKIKP